MKASHVVALLVVVAVIVWFVASGRRTAAKLERSKVLGLPPVGGAQLLELGLGELATVPQLPSKALR